MMELTDFQEKIGEMLPGNLYRMNEPLSKHTSFRIGGPAEIMAFPKNEEELRILLETANLLDNKAVILGAGTNVLAPDSGMKGLIICLKDGLNGMEVLDETRIRVMSGVTMTRAAVFAASHGMSGMEFAHGIPGTVGGGIYMNAGAYGGEISKICESVRIMRPNGEILEMNGSELGFSYRHSLLQETENIVLSAVFRLKKDDSEIIRERMKELMAKRSASQPLDLPSAGSAFKRPVGGYAAALIDESGLKGYRVGQAGISEKHAGFAVNLGNATSEEVKRLLSDVSDIVCDKTGIRLEPEIRIW